MYVVLLAKGDTKNGQLPAGFTEVPTIEQAKALLKRTTAPELVGTYTYEGIVLYLFGYKTGRATTENKHELPPPHDTVLLFGDAILIGVKDNNIVNFDTKMYTVFYEKAFGGFEDLGDEDTDDEEEDEEEAEEEEVEDVEEEEEEEEEEEIEEEEVPKKIVRVSKAKRPVKKCPTWFNNEELQKESYEV